MKNRKTYTLSTMTTPEMNRLNRIDAAAIRHPAVLRKNSSILILHLQEGVFVTRDCVAVAVVVHVEAGVGGRVIAAVDTRDAGVGADHLLTQNGVFFIDTGTGAA
jgi:hypothetical protein